MNTSISKMGETAASMDKAKEYIGEVFSRVGSSFRGRRTQSMHRRSEMASFYSRQNNKGKRNIDEDNNNMEQPFLDRLKSYCLSAFQRTTGNESNTGNDASSITNRDTRHNSNASIEEKDVLQMKRSRSVRCNVSISITSLEESMLHSYYNSTTRRRSIQTEIIRKTACEKGKAYGSRLIPQQNNSTDSGVCTDFAECISEQQIFVDEQCSTSSYFELRESCENMIQDETIREYNEITNARQDEYKEVSERIETDIEETFSKNYSVFCEKLSSIQKRASISRDQTHEVMSRSASYHPLMDPLTKTQSTLNPQDSLISDGLIKISLQHFQKSRQLRIVLHSVESSVEHNRNMFCKVTLTGKRKPQKEKSRNFRSKNGNADIKETFYMNTGEDLNGYVLKVQLFTVSRILKRKAIACKAYIALETMDVDLDTTMMVKLFDPKSLKQVGNDETVDIISENRSIHAEVTAKVHGTTETSNSKLMRHFSLPHLRYDGIILKRSKRAMTVNSRYSNNTS